MFGFFLPVSVQEMCKSTIESVRLTRLFRKFNGEFAKETCNRMTPNTSQNKIIISCNPPPPSNAMFWSLVGEKWKG